MKLFIYEVGTYDETYEVVVVYAHNREEADGLVIARGQQLSAEEENEGMKDYMDIGRFLKDDTLKVREVVLQEPGILLKHTV